jgi:FkbM family methyltransferase
MKSDNVQEKIKIKQEHFFYRARDPISNKEIKFDINSDWTLFRAKTLLSKEPETISWLRGFEKGSVFYDVGANVGAYSLFASLISEAKTFSFEPSSSNFVTLVKNINMNGIQKVAIPYCIGLDNITTFTRLYMPNLELGSSGHSVGEAVDPLLKPADFPFSQGIFSTTLDDLIEKWGFPVPNYVKIDVDNIEHKIIEGAFNLLQNQTLKSVLIEMNTEKEKGFKILKTFEKFGFYFEQETTEARMKKEGWNSGEANYIFFRE